MSTNPIDRRIDPETGLLQESRKTACTRKELARLLVEDVVRVARLMGQVPSKNDYFNSGVAAFSPSHVDASFSSWTTLLKAGGLREAPDLEAPEAPRKPRVLVFDIETAPMLSYVWGMFDQNVGLNQIHSDWYVLSWCAKWLGEDEIFYGDQRNAPDIENDKALLEPLWALLDEADAVCGQNAKKFDVKKVNARFIIHGMQPPSPYRVIDTMLMAKKNFAFTSNKLEYLSGKLCSEKKLTHQAYPGFSLWQACLKGDVAAWNEMAAYNCQDVKATEELYLKLAPWGGAGTDLNMYRGGEKRTCSCGSTSFQKRGFNFSMGAKHQRWQCLGCGAWSSDKGQSNNLLSGKTREDRRKGGQDGPGT